MLQPPRGKAAKPSGTRPHLAAKRLAVDGQYRCWVQHDGQRQLNLDRWWANVAAAKGSPASCQCPSWARLRSARLDPFHASLVGSAAVHLIVALPLSVTHQKATPASPGITSQYFKLTRGKCNVLPLPCCCCYWLHLSFHRQVAFQSFVCLYSCTKLQLCKWCCS